MKVFRAFDRKQLSELDEDNEQSLERKLDAAASAFAHRDSRLNLNSASFANWHSSWMADATISAAKSPARVASRWRTPSSRQTVPSTEYAMLSRFCATAEGGISW